ncbi:MAG: hypothetical protein KJN73_02860 [Acidimicrobiia bacterium]|nr:hypothetical protein [Acidimicrobiia bacterium]
MTGSPSLGDELFDHVRSLDLPAGDYAVFGSGPLIVRGIVEATNDLDIICRSEAWERVREVGEISSFDDGNECVNLLDGRITFGVTWKYGAFDLDELIDTAEIIEGLPFVQLEHVVAYKEAADRPKDRKHLEQLGRSLAVDGCGQVPANNSEENIDV